MKVDYARIKDICESGLVLCSGRKISQFMLVCVLVDVYGLVDAEILGLVERAYKEGYCEC